MKRKFSVANYLKNKFQKGTIILITSMFLTIPNMRVYSFVGNYKTSSPAIKANNICDLHTNKEMLLNFPVAQAVIMVGSIFIAIAVAIAVTEDMDNRGLIMDPTLESNHFNHYKKYNFSQFDN